MFNASLPGEAGNAAWEELRAGPMATASLPESERKALNQLEVDRAVDRHLAANPDIQPGEAHRLRELAGKNIAGDNTLSAEVAGLVVAQSAQVAEQQRQGAQELIFGGQPGSLQPGDPVYQSRLNVLRDAGNADYDDFGASFVDSDPQVGVSEPDSNAQASVQDSADKGRVAQPPAPGLASESVEMGQAGDPRIEEEEDAPLMGQPVQAESAQAKGPVASATTPLTKAAKLSVSFDGPQPPKKAFTSLDAEPYQALGQAINAELAERGLKAAPGMARIEVNQKPVYCFFDSTGQARAILPKGQAKASGSATITNLGDFSALDESLYRDTVLATKKEFSGSKTELSDLSWLKKAVPEELFGFLTNQGLDVSDFLAPLDDGGRVLVQFKLYGDPWMAELTLRVGADVGDIDADDPANAPLSINAFPLDQLLPDGETAIEALAEKVPHAQLLKNARVTYSHEYPWVRTTVNGDYVKKFKQAGEGSKKLPFFENLVNHDHGGAGGSPGIINRMLVGVPTADYKKTISPPAASKLMSNATLRSERLDEFKSAALTAVDDLFIVTKEGFSPPESKRDHYLFDPKKGKKLEIKMIDFNTGKLTSESAKAKNFKDGVEFLSGQVRNVLEKVKPALGEAAITGFLKDLQDHANKKVKT